MSRQVAAWVPDALMAGADVVAMAVTTTGAVVLQARRPAAVAGAWAVVALRQGWLAVRAFRRSGG